MHALWGLRANSYLSVGWWSQSWIISCGRETLAASPPIAPITACDTESTKPWMRNCSTSSFPWQVRDSGCWINASVRSCSHWQSMAGVEIPHVCAMVVPHNARVGSAAIFSRIRRSHGVLCRLSLGIPSQSGRFLPDIPSLPVSPFGLYETSTSAHQDSPSPDICHLPNRNAGSALGRPATGNC